MMIIDLLIYLLTLAPSFPFALAGQVGPIASVAPFSPGSPGLPYCSEHVKEVQLGQSLQCFLGHH